MYTVDWVGTVALGVLENGQPKFAFALEDEQRIPAEFKQGDELRIVNRPDQPAHIAVEMNSGYYEITHVPSGKVLHIHHRVYGYLFK